MKVVAVRGDICSCRLTCGPALGTAGGDCVWLPPFDNALSRRHFRARWAPVIPEHLRADPAAHLSKDAVGPAHWPLTPTPCYSSYLRWAGDIGVVFVGVILFLPIGALPEQVPMQVYGGPGHYESHLSHLCYLSS